MNLSVELDPSDLDGPLPETPPERDQPFAEAADREAIVESRLFVSPTPLALQTLMEVTGLDEVVLRETLLGIVRRNPLCEGRSGIVLSEVAGGYQLRSAERHRDFVRRLLGVKPQRLTRAALETLALVAYRQPVTRPEIEEIRGVDCGAVLS